MKLTKQNLRTLRTRLVRICDEARSKGFNILAGGVYVCRADSPFDGGATKRCCVRGAIDVTNKVSGVYDQAKLLGIRHEQLDRIESGFEGWDAHHQTMKSKLYRLGASIRRRYDKRAS